MSIKNVRTISKAKIINFSLGLLIAMSLISQLLLILHYWAYAIVLYFGSKVCFGIVYMLKINQKGRLDFINGVKVVLILSWVLIDLLSILLGFHIPFYLLNGHVFLWIWIFVLGFEGLMDSFNKRQLLSNIIFILAAVIIFLGALTKILHLTGANVLLYIGLALGAYWLIAETFKKKV